jgi:protein-S-isoprenylcysteine O-methyltransferase Ste14
MAPYVEDHAVASGLFGVTVALWVIGEFRQAIRRRPEAVKADRHSLGLLRVTLVAGWLCAGASRSLVPGATIGGGAVVFAIGFAAAWMGLALRGWAIASLGRLYTITVMTSSDQPVVDRGPYRVLRHPGYAGLLLILLGAGVMFGNWVGVAALAVLPGIGLVVRIRVEERALTMALGSAYRDFAQGRKRMIPNVW